MEEEVFGSILVDGSRFGGQRAVPPIPFAGLESQLGMAAVVGSPCSTDFIFQPNFQHRVPPAHAAARDDGLSPCAGTRGHREGSSW